MKRNDCLEDKMAKSVEQRASEAVNYNVDRYLSDPRPGIRTGTRSAQIAKCKNGCHGLHTGLGAMGVGTMWGSADKSDEMWDQLPVQECDCEDPTGLRKLADALEAHRKKNELAK